jgi:hypothetical protein
LIPVEVLNSPARLSSGVLSKYYKGANWEGEPYQVFVDRFLQFPEEPPYIPFSVTWEGSTNITAPGEYRFALRSTNHSWMYLDDELILDVDTFDPQNPNERHESEAQVELTEGLHRVRITYGYEAGDRQIEIFWERPGAGRERLPLEIFTPAPQ